MTTPRPRARRLLLILLLPTALGALAALAVDQAVQYYAIPYPIRFFRAHRQDFAAAVQQIRAGTAERDPRWGHLLVPPALLAGEVIAVTVHDDGIAFDFVLPYFDGPVRLITRTTAPGGPAPWEGRTPTMSVVIDGEWRYDEYP